MITLPDWLAQRAIVALLGEITPNIRGIAMGYKQPDMTLRVYLDAPPTDDDQERFEIVLTEIFAGTQKSQIDRQDLHFHNGSEPIRLLDHLDGWIYIRHDPSLQAT